MELAQVSSTHVAHARRDCAYEILASVIDLGRSEQYLSQRAGRPDMDSCPPRQIRVGCSHSPVITLSRGFHSFGKGATDHDCIRPTGERLANVTALTHTAIGDDWNILSAFFIEMVASGRAVDRCRNLGYA